MSQVLDVAGGKTGWTSLNAISEALTHSDIQITKTYVNTWKQ